MTAINSALENDLTGQAGAESIGHTLCSGIGGQADFMRGAGLIEETRRQHLICHDQEYLPGGRGEYPEQMETRKTTRRGQAILLRPVRISDGPLIKERFSSLSDRSMYRRFLTPTREMSHERLQDFVVIDYTREIMILAVAEAEGGETLAGLGEYY